MESLTPYLANHPAWQQAWRLRCCPPDHVLVKPADIRLREHLELCPWCRETMDLPLCLVPEMDALDPPETSPLAPGQLYALNPKLAGWGPKARYYNPPIVLTVSFPDAHSVFVCQAYGDSALAGPDDVALGPEFSGFVQPWNCYTLMREDLEMHLGTVDAPVVEMVRQRIEQNQFSPQPGSLLWFFRQLEVETGYFFSSRAVSQLLAKHEDDTTALFAQTDSRQVLQDLHCLPLRLAAVDPAKASPLDLLFWTEPDPQRLPLAAADAETTSALAFALDQGRLTGVEIQPLTISSCEYADGLLTVTGSVAFQPSGNLTWFLRWQTGEDLIEPLPENSGHDGLLFWATFSLTPQQATPPARLVVRILCEHQG